MSDNLARVTLDQARIKNRGTVNATMSYTTDFGGTVHVTASNGFDVVPQSVYLAEGTTTTSQDLVISMRGALPAPVLCTLTFAFVVNFQRAAVNVE